MQARKCAEQHTITVGEAYGHSDEPNFELKRDREGKWIFHLNTSGYGYIDVTKAIRVAVSIEEEYRAAGTTEGMD